MIVTELTVDVTQQDLHDGQPGSTELCAVALAALRSARVVYCENACVSVGGNTMLVWGQGDEGFFSVTFILPPEARRNIVRIDEGKQVDPFKFTVGSKAV